MTPEQEAALRRQAQQVIPERVAYYAARMGLTPAGVRITGARTASAAAAARTACVFPGG